MLLKKHLTKNGFYSILKLYASINRGISKQVSYYYSNIEPFRKIKSKHPNKLNPYWVSGFVAGDGSFVLGLRRNTMNNKRFGIYYNFNIAQDSKDLKLMKLFISYFKCGKVILRMNKSISRCDYLVQDLNSIMNNIIPHFD